jgi:dTDP-4-amino-4,6-dideoxygalactose transaminase
MNKYRIPFNRARFEGNEQAYIAQAMASGHISGGGEFTRRCESFLERELGSKKALLTTSCTDALEMCALLLDIQPGDEVIVPTFTFVSSANAFVLRGAKPVFCDIRPDTLNLDQNCLAGLITRRTRAIVVVHYAGVACELDTILRIAEANDIAVIEDNAHGLFGRYRGRYLGTFGVLATQSFHETKNFTCGEGGALLINDPRFIERAEILREKGTDRSRFFRGEIDKYTWVDVGSSFLPSDVNAAFLYAQLEARERIQEVRRNIWQTYHAGLSHWARENGVRLPYVPSQCDQAYHMFYLLLPSLEERELLRKHLGEHGILSVFHYLPLHLSSMGRKLGGIPGQCPNAESVSERLLRLPFYNDLSPTDQQSVIDAVHNFVIRTRAKALAC